MVEVAAGAREAETAAPQAMAELQAMAAVATDGAVAGAAAAATAAMETMPTTVLMSTEVAAIEGAWVLRGGPRANSGGSRAPPIQCPQYPLRPSRLLLWVLRQQLRLAWSQLTYNRRSPMLRPETSGLDAVRFYRGPTR